MADATREVSTTALAETFLGGSLALVMALVAARWIEAGTD